jgi:hypothetical protein
LKSATVVVFLLLQLVPEIACRSGENVCRESWNYTLFQEGRNWFHRNTRLISFASNLIRFDKAPKVYIQLAF